MLLTLRTIFTISLEQGLAYAFISLAGYITFRVLSFPDLTPDGSFALGAAVAAVMIVRGQSPYLATLVGALAGALAGLTTGVLNTKLNINKILAGILTLTAVYSINLRVMGRANVSLLRVSTLFDGIYHLLRLEGGPYSLICILAGMIGLVLLFLTWFFHTDLGLAVRATGDNERMIRGLGVNTDNTKLLGLGLANGLVGLSGALVAQDQGFADIGMGIGTIVGAFAGLIIGETLFTTPSVGRGMLAIVLGVIIYRLLLTTALYLGLAPTDLKIASAVLVTLALGLPWLHKSYLERF